GSLEDLEKEQNHLLLLFITNLSKDLCFLCAGAVAGAVHIH
ncbi:unnamed protein product, partial [Urochloa humidicola]